MLNKFDKYIPDDCTLKVLVVKVKTELMTLSVEQQEEVVAVRKWRVPSQVPTKLLVTAA